MEGLLYLGGPHRVLLDFNPPFSFILFDPKGNRADKKWNKVLDREVNHKLNRGTQFYGDSVSNPQAQTGCYQGGGLYLHHLNLLFLLLLLVRSCSRNSSSNISRGYLWAG